MAQTFSLPVKKLNYFFNFVKFMATKKARKLIFSSLFLLLLDLGPRGIKIRIQDKYPGSATPVEWEV
jgi:hypothetical protein